MATNVVKMKRTPAIDTLDKFTEMLSAVKEAQELLGQRDGLEAQIKTLQTTKDELAGSVELLQKELDTVKKSTASATAKLKTEHDLRLKALDSAYKSALDTHTEKMNALNDDLKAAEAAVKGAREKAVAAYFEESTKVTDGIQAKRAELKTLESKRDEMETETKNIEARLVELKTKLRSLLDT